MRAALTLLTCSIALGFCLTGCEAQPEAMSDSASETATELSAKSTDIANTPKPAEDGYVFRARFYVGPGDCDEIGGTFAMPAIDFFAVVDVLQGDLIAKNIGVRARTQHGSAYPKNLVVGNIYTLRLRPSENTKQQLQENRKEGFSFLRVNGDELEEYQAGK